MSYATRVQDVTGAKGLLIYHDMGLGKTLLAVAIAVEMIAARMRVVMLLTKSLQDNMRDTIRLYIRMRRERDPDWPVGRLNPADWDAWINDNFSFVSMNASNMIQQMQQAAATDLDGIDAALEERLGRLTHGATTLNDHVLIIDEAHNLFRALTNGSKNAMGVYDLVMKSPRCRIFALSGTPIANDPFEMVPCFSMLSGNPTLLPPNYSEFRKIFVSPDGRSIQNVHLLQNRLFGLISRVSTTTRPGAATRANDGVSASDSCSDSCADVDMPRVYPVEVVRVRMDESQWAAYNIARDAEMAEGQTRGNVEWRGRMGDRAPPKSSPMTKPKSGMSSSYRSKSRRISDYVAGVRSPKYEAIYETVMAKPNQPGVVYSEFVNDSGLRPFGDFLIEKGWQEVIIDMKKTGGSPALPDCVIGGDDGDIDSADDVGVNNDADTADAEIADDSDDGVPKFAIYSGNIDTDARLLMKARFNSPKNRHGGYLRLLLFSATGAEGLDLKRGRHAHIMEPYWNDGRHKQIVNRIARNGSHSDLPPEERDVRAYIYLAVPPLGHESASPTTDEELYADSIDDAVLNDSCVGIYDTVSIECAANGGKDCLMCAPTDRPLFTDDIHRDLRGSNPCTGIVEKRVTAVEITIGEKQYWYAKAADNPFGWKVWYYDEKIRAHMPLRQDDPMFLQVVSHANASTSAGANMNANADG